MKGDIGMANYEKQVEQEAAYPIPISLYNCYRTVRQEKRGIGPYREGMYHINFCEGQRVRFCLKIATWKLVGLCSERKQKEMKALKCKTLGGIQYIMHCQGPCIILRMRVECLAAPCRPSPVSRLFHGGC